MIELGDAQALRLSMFNMPLGHDFFFFFDRNDRMVMSFLLASEMSPPLEKGQSSGLFPRVESSCLSSTRQRKGLQPKLLKLCKPCDEHSEFILLLDFLMLEKY